MTFITTLFKKKRNTELLFADTDILNYEIKSEDVYEDFYKDNHLFDLSNYPKDSQFFDTINEKITAKLKDVCEGKVNDEFVGLKSKMHSIKNIDRKESNMAKGVNIATEFNELKDTLFNKKVIRHKMGRTQSRKHKTRTCENNKISLSCFDDKKFVLDDGIQMIVKSKMF